MNEQKFQGSPPFKTLGTHLKYLREQSNESLQEASGAVEIDLDMLQRIEAGTERPSEDILLLLIQHYNTHDHEALQLWELAGYDGNEAPQKVRLEDLLGPNGNKQVVMLMTNDVRTMYSDGLDINVNQAGITLTFTQVGGNGRALPVGRVGMGYDQAVQVLQTLHEALTKAHYLRNPKGLPAPDDEQRNSIL